MSNPFGEVIFRATVAVPGDNEATIIPLGTSVATQRPYKYALDGMQLSAGDDVYVIPISGTYVLLGGAVAGGGGSLPAGGTAGDVLVKNGAADYAAEWTNTPPQMGSLAYINAGSTAARLYQPGEYLVYNGQLYKVGGTAIGPDETLTPGGNIISTTVSDNLFDIGSPGVVDIPQFVASGYITGSGNYVDFGLPLKAKNGLNISASILTASTLFTPPSARHNDVISSLRVANRNSFLLTLEGTLSSTMTANQVCTVAIIGLRITATNA